MASLYQRLAPSCSDYRQGLRSSSEIRRRLRRRQLRLSPGDARSISPEGDCHHQVAPRLLRLSSALRPLLDQPIPFPTLSHIRPRDHARSDFASPDAGSGTLPRARSHSSKTWRPRQFNGLTSGGISMLASTWRVFMFFWLCTSRAFSNILVFRSGLRLPSYLEFLSFSTR